MIKLPAAQFSYSVMSRYILLLVLKAVVASATIAAAENAIPSKSNYMEIPMIPAFIPPDEMRSSYWRISAADTLKAKLQEKVNTNKAKNGIFFIGDGMSVATIMASRTFAGQLEKELGEDNTLSFEKFPVTGLARTYCLDAQVPDSACTATAYLTGVKTKYGTIGINGNVTRASCHSQLHQQNVVTSIAQWALDRGLDVGVVTTTRVTHASPAGTYAHTSERNWESDADMMDDCKKLGCKDIAYQLVMENPGKEFKVILGGGRREFTPFINDSLTPSSGKRSDGLDLIEMWHKEKLAKNVTHQYVTDRNELLKVASSEELPEYLLGLFHESHMEYHMKAQNQPTLEEMTEVAIRMLSRNEKGYFLFVEGGRIDHAHHASMAHLAFDETVEYAKAVAKARQMTSVDDTLIVVSADHAHTMTVAGYPSRGNNILGVVDTDLALDGLPYATISYANGNGPSIDGTGKRVDVTKISDFVNGVPDAKYPSLVPVDSETHGGEDVVVFASGPWQHLFTASYEQNVIPHLIAYSMCLTDNRHENCDKHFSLWPTSSGVSVRINLLSILPALLCLFRVML